jgi:uncharacterized protein
MTTPRHPYELAPSRRLVLADDRQHVADLVRLVLLTNPAERLHRPDFGAGLGASALFEGRDAARLGMIEARARGSLTDALGDRIHVERLEVRAEGESTIVVDLAYRVRTTGDGHTLQVRMGRPS